MSKPTQRRPRPDIDEERILTEALALIDERGLGALSMRSLAERLSVYPTTIYWYVDTRNALLAAVVEKVLGDILPAAGPAELDWQEWIGALMRSYREAVMRHPNVAPLLGADLTSNPGVDITVVEQLLSRLEQAGFRDDALLHAYNSVMAGMIGFVTLELSAAPRDDETWAEELRDRYRTANPEVFPAIHRWVSLIENRAFVVRWQNGAVAPMTQTYEAFIATLLAGLEQVLAGGLRSPPPSGGRTSARATTRRSSK